MRRNLLFLSGLLLLTIMCFWPIGRLGFIDYDDGDYVYKNPQVQSGLNVDSLRWAFTAVYANNWHPLTWVSHMLDCEVFGLNPAGMHWVNLGFHIATTVLLFLWLHDLTGARWRSFLVAALFAVHPLHVQSVAWISERKDVLSGFFALGTLLAYTRYCRHKTTGTYALVVMLFALGLMAKPMLVTLPLVLLLLDFWPLNRTASFQFSASNLKPMFVEKIPLFLLSLVSCVATLWAQNQSGATVPLDQIGLLERTLHAVSSYSLYLGKIFWPVNLAIFYPITHMALEVLVATLLLPVFLTRMVFWQKRAKPYLFIGWFWFVITLIPVIGLVQVGIQSIADRYAYLPSIGIFVMVSWGMAEIAAKSKAGHFGMVALGAALLLVCGLDTRYQLGFWRDSVSLFKRVVAVTPQNNEWGYYCLGNTFLHLGNLEDAAKSFTLSLEANDKVQEPRVALGRTLLSQKKFAEAEFQLSKISPPYPKEFSEVSAHMYLGMALDGQEKYANALSEYQAALQLEPGNKNIVKYLDATTRHLDAELMLVNLGGQIKTNDTAEIRIQIALAQNALGHNAEAVQNYRLALAREPDSLDGLNNLAWMLATCSDDKLRNGAEAVTLSQRACQQTKFGKTIFIGTLAAGYAEAGQFDDAIATAQRACDLAEKNGEKDLLERNMELLSLYRSHQAYHDSP